MITVHCRRHVGPALSTQIVASPSIPGYERLNQIGKGGFSRVYAGEQAKLKRVVAIKVLNFGLSDEADRRSFERECELMGRVSTHPNIVTVHDTAFTDNGQPCIVMEHYPGGSIAELISEVGRLHTKEALEVGVAIAGALEASHQAGVLHCDLKPQNILVSEFGQPALGDFGISTFSEERTRTGGDAGAGFTLAYAAPEIVEGASPSVQSDLYSLAATLYTALAGRRPFYYLNAEGEKPTAAEQARRILLEPPASLVDEGVPPELDAIIRAAMDKDPTQRPDSAADFARTLFEVGRRLGHGTSAPRIADQGALSVPGVVAGSIAPEWDPAKQQEQLDLTELRRADATALRVDMPRPQLAPEPVTSNRRRLLAPLIGLASLIAVAVVVFMVSQSEPAADPEPAAPTRTPDEVAAPVLPPPAPRDTQVVRVGEESILVSWSNAPQEDVEYEIRFDTQGADPVATSSTSPVVIDGIATQDVPCVTVAAKRGSRLTLAPGRRCVSPRLTGFLASVPGECSAPCTVDIQFSDVPMSERADVDVIRIGSGASDNVSINTSVQGVGSEGAESPPRFELIFDDEAVAGVYLVTVEDPDTDLVYQSITRVTAPE